MSIHFWGLGRDLVDFKSAYFEPATPWLAIPWEKAAGRPADWVLWADVVQQSNKTLLVGEVNLVDALAKYPGRRWILNVRSNVVGIDQQIAGVLADKKWDGRILIQSDYDNVLTSLKKLKPFFVYGATPADRMRLRIFDSLWLLTASPLKGDVYVGPLRVGSVPLLDKGIAREIHRRHKRIFVGPLETPEDVEAARGLGADGFYSTSPALLRNVLVVPAQK